MTASMTGRDRSTWIVAVALVALLTCHAVDAAEPATTQPTIADSSKIDQLVADLGSDSWAVRESAQKQIIGKMDPNTFALMNRLRGVLDPKGIMNPGNWEAD